MRVNRPLPQGPGLALQRRILQPPAPRSSGWIGPTQCKYEFRVRFNPMTFGPAQSRPFFHFQDDPRADERARMLARSRSVIWLPDRRERGAEDRLRLFHRAALH